MAEADPPSDFRSQAHKRNVGVAVAGNPGEDVLGNGVGKGACRIDSPPGHGYVFIHEEKAKDMK